MEKTHQTMRSALLNTVRLLQSIGVKSYVYGSFALCLYAGESVGSPQDIDLAFGSREDHDRAVEHLENAHVFKRVKQIVWESDTGEESVNTKDLSPEGVEFDFSYTRGDIDVDLDPKRTIDVDGVAVPVLSLDDIRKSYERFFDEKPGAATKIALIDRLRKRSPDDFDDMT